MGAFLATHPTTSWRSMPTLGRSPSSRADCVQGRARQKLRHATRALKESLMIEREQETRNTIESGTYKQSSSVTLLRPGAVSVLQSVTELLRSWELLRLLAWREVRLRYSQTALGVVWAILQPLLPMVVFTVLFSRIAAFASTGLPYPVFVYSGLMLWGFFSSALANSSSSLVESPDLVTKVYFPRILIPTSAIVAALVDLGVQLAVFLPLLAYYRIPVVPALVAFPMVALYTGVLALSVGLFFSALNVKYRDVRYALPFVAQLWMIASPIMYPTTVVPVQFRRLWLLNPLAAGMEAYRSVLMAQPVEWVTLSASCAIIVALLLGGLLAFTRMEEHFADLI